MPNEDDDANHDVIVTTTIPPSTVTPPAGFPVPGSGSDDATPTDHPDRPINSKPTPTNTDSVTGELEASPDATSTSTAEGESNWLPGFLPTFGVGPRAQAWIYASLALILAFCTALGVYLFMARRRRLRNSPRDNYEFELLDDGEAEGLTGARGGARGTRGEKIAGAAAGGAAGAGRKRGGELYDAFAGGSDDDFDDDVDNGIVEGQFYRDHEEGVTGSSGDNAALREKRALGEDEEHHVLGTDSEEEEEEGDERRGLAAGRR